jgi:polyferredoxin
VLGLLGTQIGDGEFEDINLFEVIYKTFSVLVCSALLSMMIYSFTEWRANSGVAGRAQTNQVPGQFLITVFLFILLSFVFGGFFTPEPVDEGREMEYSEPWE